MSKKPLIVFLVPADELTDESVAVLNEVLGQVPRMLVMFRQYNPNVQSMNFVASPYDTSHIAFCNCPACTRQLNIEQYICPDCIAAEKCGKHDR